MWWGVARFTYAPADVSDHWTDWFSYQLVVGAAAAWIAGDVLGVERDQLFFDGPDIGLSLLGGFCFSLSWLAFCGLGV